MTDSAGVVIAESFRPAWGVGGSWSVAPEPEPSIVRMPDGLALEQVADGRFYGGHRDELGVATVRVRLIDEGGIVP